MLKLDAGSFDVGQSVNRAQNGYVRDAHEILALALALTDEGRSEQEVVAALIDAAEGHILRLQSAYASTLYLTEALPLDERASRLSRTFLKALEHVSGHESSGVDVSADMTWLGGHDHEPRSQRASRLATATGDRDAVLRNAEQLRADLERLRRGPQS